MLIRSSKVYFLTALSLRSLETPRTQSYYFFFLSAERAERKKQHPFGSALVAISAGCSLILYRNLFRRTRERFAIAILSTAMAKNFLFASSLRGVGPTGRRLRLCGELLLLSYRHSIEKA
jgi:hypothetical protein